MAYFYNIHAIIIPVTISYQISHYYRLQSSQLDKIVDDYSTITYIEPSSSMNSSQ